MSGFGVMGPGLAAARLEERKRRQATRGQNKRRGRGPMMGIFSVFPLLTIPVVVYNLMAFVFNKGPDLVAGEAATTAPALASTLAAPIVSVPMVSGASWTMDGSDILILISLLFLFVEILKSTSTGTATILNHAVSMILFIVCLVEFLLFKNFATSAFFILTMMTLLDVLAGVVVTIVSARRDFAVGEGFN
ncbi:hypothetical protein [Ponticaulis profundi]|uniref:Transmembrane protein n=1 Tax=Ponticaulis profundi TaxID=2665222 RepID=A0ABW1S862_9PROT